MQPKLEYTLSQVCFQDDCSSQTQKAILKMAVDKEKEIYQREYITNFQARSSNLFLMSIILVKEEDAAFIMAIHESTIIQNALGLGMGNFIPEKELSDYVCQIAIKFLSKHQY